jgi:hypothetical protein
MNGRPDRHLQSGLVAARNIVDGAESADLVDPTRLRSMAQFALWAYNKIYKTGMCSAHQEADMTCQVCYPDIEAHLQAHVEVKTELFANVGHLASLLEQVLPQIAAQNSHMAASIREALEMEDVSEAKDGYKDIITYAENWETLTECAHMSILGSAGFHGDQGQGDPGDYRHFGLNFWSIVQKSDKDYFEGTSKNAIEMLEKFIAVLKKTQLKQYADGYKKRKK